MTALVQMQNTSYCLNMSQLTLCYSNHRPEMLQPAAEIMPAYEVIMLEEPPHPNFQAMLRRDIDLDEYILESETEFPEFTKQHCSLLQNLHASGKTIHQVEPYLEHLLHIQLYLADGHSPGEITNGTVEHQVYLTERHATGKLIDYYKAVGSGHYDNTISAMMAFAEADAARFLLRDRLRSKAIVTLLQTGRKTFIEAGPMHQSLQGLLREKIGKQWSLSTRSIEHELATQMGISAHLLAPGDILTLAYMDKRSISQDQQRLLCAQTLIYAKITMKEEMINSESPFPHFQDESQIIGLVASLDLTQCTLLYDRIKNLPTRKARESVLGKT